MDRSIATGCDFLAVGLSPAVQKTLLFSCVQKGEVNRSERYYIAAAGKCVNVCRVLVQGGMKARCLTIAGEENRDFFQGLCDRDGVDASLIPSEGRVRTCTTLLENDGTTTELVVNEPEPVSRKTEDAFIDEYIRLLDSGVKYVLVSGSRLPGFSNEIIPFMVKAAKERAVFYFADYKGEDLKNSLIDRTVRPDLIKINEDEFVSTFPGYDNLEAGLLAIAEKYFCEIVISRGKEPTVFTYNAKVQKVPSEMVQPVNTIGCGDSMFAGIAKGHYEYGDLEKAVLLGRDYATRNALNIQPGWITEG